MVPRFLGLLYQNCMRSIVVTHSLELWENLVALVFKVTSKFIANRRFASHLARANLSIMGYHANYYKIRAT